MGWTGLPPIAVFIEYILGVKSDYSEGRIVWDIEHTEVHGIERYPYGPDGVVGLKVKRRASAGETPSVSVETNVPFDLTVTWATAGAVRSAWRRAARETELSNPTCL